jgi:hypothetical protein
VDAVERFGKACANPGSFKGSILALLSSSPTSAKPGAKLGFAEAIRKVIKGGGCNCSRANFAGACLGAAYGFEGELGIPLDWLVRTDKAEEILQLALEKVGGSSTS